MRQLTPDVHNKTLTVFEPGRAIRGINNAAIQYFLAEELEKVTIEILDASGKVIRTIEGTREEDTRQDERSQRSRRSARGCSKTLP